ncbi:MULTISPECIES: porin [unclassified Caballeronia]|uniref:porin n=1 Tax=unclassified Caballeronia TaxID=2646786 RepID=UPI0028544D44|nr:MULTISPECIES: porin [unclassified Caballeronia]MDR5752434.1 porin [Caballeronia sp. LZ024]MDR5845240.1 porin [Caballeronia sp. LZ031]
MKKACLMAVLVACTPAAHAQSSVTLYGLIDTALSWQTNQVASTAANGRATSSGSSVALGPGFFNGSRWGLLGSEDLGGGTTAIFRIEAGFNPTTGVSLQGNREFGRQAYVGLKGAYGQLTLGRQYSVPFDTLLPYDTIGWGNSAASDVWVQLLAGSRLDNTAKYTLNIDQWKFSAAYSFGGQAGSISHGSTYAAGLNYQGSVFGAGLTAQQAKDFAGNKQSNLGAGALINVGPVTLHGYYLYTRRDGAFTPTTGQDFSPTYGGYAALYTNPGNTNIGASSAARTDNVFQLGATWQTTPSVQIKAAAIYDLGRHVNANGESGNKLSTFLTGDYFLSKRTDVYLAGAFSKVSASFNGPYASENDSASVTLGLRHRF